MKQTAYRDLVLALVIAVLIVGVMWRLISRRADQMSATPPAAAAVGEKAKTHDLPAVIDLGMGKCIPCRKMKPILDELAREYEGRARIEIIDIGEQPDAADRYRLELIPTQVFVDAEGNEVYRHEGFMPKEDIVAKLKEMGVE